MNRVILLSVVAGMLLATPPTPRHRMRVGTVTSHSKAVAFFVNGAKTRTPIVDGKTTCYEGDILVIPNGSRAHIVQKNGEQYDAPGTRWVAAYKESPEEHRLADVVANLPAAVKPRGARVFTWPRALPVLGTDFSVVADDLSQDQVWAKVTTGKSVVWEGFLERQDDGEYVSRPLQRILAYADASARYTVQVSSGESSRSETFTLLAPDQALQLAGELAEADRHGDWEGGLMRLQALDQGLQYGPEQCLARQMLNMRPASLTLKSVVDRLARAGY